MHPLPRSQHVVQLGGDYTAVATLGWKDGWCTRMPPNALKRIIQKNQVLQKMLQGRPIQVLDIICKMGLDVKVTNLSAPPGFKSDKYATGPEDTHARSIHVADNHASGAVSRSKPSTKTPDHATAATTPKTPLRAAMSSGSGGRFGLLPEKTLSNSGVKALSHGKHRGSRGLRRKLRQAQLKMDTDPVSSLTLMLTEATPFIVSGAVLASCSTSFPTEAIVACQIPKKTPSGRLCTCLTPAQTLV